MENKIITLIKRNTSHILWNLLPILAFLLVWELATIFTGIGRLMPGPVKIIQALFKSFVTPLGPYTIQVHALFSIKRIMIGYGVAVFTGIAFGVGIGLSRLFRALFRPIFELIRPIPTVAWIPISILWFGIDEMSKYFIVFYGAFANVALSVYMGIQRVDPVLVGAAKMLGCSDRQVTLKVVLPSTVPYIFSGIQVALSAGIMSVVVAEMINSYEGIGWNIHAGQQVADMTQVLTGMVALAVLGLLMAVILRQIERKMCAWNTRNI
jgi:NitT/TauT family transport system permease protein/sulfonate transport system permease protein